MTNLNQKTLDQLLYLSDWIKERKYPTQRGRDKMSEALSAIEAELDSRQPGVDFRTLYGDWVTFRDKKTREPVGFEPIYGDCSDDYNE